MYSYVAVTSKLNSASLIRSNSFHSMFPFSSFWLSRKASSPISTFAHVCSLFGTFGREKKLVKPVNPRVKVRSTGFYPIAPPWVAAGTNHAPNASTGHTLYSDKKKNVRFGYFIRHTVGKDPRNVTQHRTRNMPNSECPESFHGIPQMQ